jgi:hypothetical protein
MQSFEKKNKKKKAKGEKIVQKSNGDLIQQLNSYTT